MEHYYVVNGNEFGIDLDTKKNFAKIEEARDYFERVKYDDFGCIFMHVDSSGVEDIVDSYTNF
jgi:hypothetical protein